MSHQPSAVSSQLVDQFGRPFPPTQRPDAERFSLASIRDRYYAYPAQGLTPERLATILREADQGDVLRQAELFEEMAERDAKLLSLLHTRMAAVQGLPWSLAPADDSPGAAEVAAQVETWLQAAPMARLIAHLLDAIPYGYSAAELMWAADGRTLRIQEISPVPIRRLTYLPCGAEPLPEIPRLITDQEPVYGIELPAWKFALHRYQARPGNATRAGLMRTCAWLYVFKHYTIKDWVAFAEVYGMPLRLGKYQPGASAEDREALLRAVQAIGHDAAGIISASTELEFIQAAQRQTPDIYESLINLVNKELAQAILGQTLTSDVGSVGSLAAAKVHDEVRFDLTKADATALGETITAQLVRPLVGFNLGWDVPVPRFTLTIEEPQNLKDDAEVLKTLSEAGFGPVIPLAIVHEQFGIRAPKDGEATVGVQPSAVSRQQAALKVLPLAQARTDAVVHEEQAPVDALAATAPADWEPLMQPLIEPVRRMIEESASFEEARDRVLLAYGEMDDAPLAELLARAMFASDAWGRLHA